MLRDVILGLLRDGKALHGYGLVKAFSARSGRSVARGNVYRELEGLVGKGLAEADGNHTAGLRGAIYRLTAAGKEAFDAWLSAPAAPQLRWRQCGERYTIDPGSRSVHYGGALTGGCPFSLSVMIELERPDGQGLTLE